MEEFWVPGLDGKDLSFRPIAKATVCDLPRVVRGLQDAPLPPGGATDQNPFPTFLCPVSLQGGMSSGG